MAAAPEVDLIVQDRSAACQFSFIRDEQTALLGVKALSRAQSSSLSGCVLLCFHLHFLCRSLGPWRFYHISPSSPLFNHFYIHTAVQQQRCFLPTPSLLQDLVLT
jgi:hypothetical protein